MLKGVSNYPMHPVSDVTAHLRFSQEGYWVAMKESAVSYPEDGNEKCFAVEDTSFWFQHRNAMLKSLVEKYPPAGEIFDIGGGNGIVSQALQAAGYPVVLVEPGPAGARNAVSRGLKHVVCCTLEDAHFRPASLPAVGLFDVLEHIQDDRAFLQTLQKLMVPNGRLYLTVPAHPWLWAAADDYAGHFRRYSQRTLGQVLIDSGFCVEYASYLFSYLLLPVFWGRTLPNFFGFRKNPSPENIEREHAAGSGLGCRLLEFCHGFERNQVRKNRRIPFGTSILAVARVAIDSARDHVATFQGAFSK